MEASLAITVVMAVMLTTLATSSPRDRTALRLDAFSSCRQLGLGGVGLSRSDAIGCCVGGGPAGGTGEAATLLLLLRSVMSRLLAGDDSSENGDKSGSRSSSADARGKARAPTMDVLPLPGGVDVGRPSRSNPSGLAIQRPRNRHRALAVICNLLNSRRGGWSPLLPAVLFELHNHMTTASRRAIATREASMMSASGFIRQRNETMPSRKVVGLE